MECIHDIQMHSTALVLCITTLLFTLVQKRTDKLQNKLFLATNLVVLLNAVCLIVAALMEPRKHTLSSAYFILRIMEYSYFVLHTLLAPLFALYVSCVTGKRSHASLNDQLKYGFVCFLSELLVISNPLHHFVYQFNVNRDFYRRWAEYVIYAAALFYFVYALIALLFTWKAITRKRRMALIYFYLITTLGVLAQLLFIEVKTELFAEALGLMGVMIAVESEDDRIDMDTGFYNRHALQDDIATYLVNRRRFAVICVKVTNAEIIQRTTGSLNTDLFSAIIGDFLKTIIPILLLQHISD